jgi:hypothetical protein
MNRPSWKVRLALAFVQLTFGVQHVAGKDALGSVPPMVLAAAYFMLQPVVGVGSAAAWLGEPLGWDEAAGFILIILGLILVSARAGLRGEERDGAPDIRPVP